MKFPRRNLTTCRDIFGCQIGKMILAETKSIQYPIMYKIAPTTKNYLVKCVISADYFLQTKVKQKPFKYPFTHFLLSLHVSCGGTSLESSLVKLWSLFLASIHHRKRGDFRLASFEEGTVHVYFRSTLIPFSETECSQMHAFQAFPASPCLVTKAAHTRDA